MNLPDALLAHVRPEHQGAVRHALAESEVDLHAIAALLDQMRERFRALVRAANAEAR